MEKQKNIKKMKGKKLSKKQLNELAKENSLRESEVIKYDKCYPLAIFSNLEVEEIRVVRDNEGLERMYNDYYDREDDNENVYREMSSEDVLKNVVVVCKNMVGSRDPYIINISDTELSLEEIEKEISKMKDEYDVYDLSA